VIIDHNENHHHNWQFEYRTASCPDTVKCGPFLTIKIMDLMFDE